MCTTLKKVRLLKVLLPLVANYRREPVRIGSFIPRTNNITKLRNVLLQKTANNFLDNTSNVQILEQLNIKKELLIRVTW